ncbi:hypothetical protein EYM_06880 [Ignicoccus islandicus DSM 13165]|uniref:Uncharacterized protein n=1 Tax=Ignicoccus islandicus DSM 13165 TaxID=940295 RepID=A0A0U3G3J4_9CREN|nr:hypothetical protein [Ignicoccus islandicus]ALU12732.1 hypothetical protein EYM_06880 [Ignicoccus islandicus DSM 13165]
MVGASKVPLILAVILAYLWLDPLEASASMLVASVIYAIASKFPLNLDVMTICSLIFSTTCYYFSGSPILPYGLFLALLSLDYRRASILLPIAILALLKGVVVSPLLGSYPVQVKVTGEEVPSVVLPVAFVAMPFNYAGIVGYSIPYLFAAFLEYASEVLPNGFMIKVSLPLLVAIAIGILLNVARVMVRGSILKRGR